MKEDKTGYSRKMATTLTLAIIALIVASLFLLGLVDLFFLVQTQKETIKGRQQVVARWAAEAVSGFIQEKFSVMEIAIRLSRSEAERQKAMQNLLGMEPAFRQLLLLNDRNEEMYRVTRMSKTESERLDRQLDNDPFGGMADKNKYISPVYMDQVTSEPLVQLLIPVTTILGDRLGLLVAEVNLKFIWQLVEGLQVGKSGYAYVVDRRGRLIAYGDTGRVLRNEKLDHLREVAEFIKGSDRQEPPGVHAATGITGERVLGTYVPLETPDWAVMTELPIREAYRPIIHTGLIFAIVILTISALAGVFAHFLARRLAAPIVELTRTASAIAKGKMDARAEVSGPAEVRQLSVAFNRMTWELSQMLGWEAEKTKVLEQEIAERKQLESTLKENEERLRDYLINVPGVAYQYVHDPKLASGKVSSVVRERMLEVFGLDSEQDNFFNIFVSRLPGNDPDRFVKSIEEAVAAEKSWFYQGDFIKPSGERICFEGRSEPRKVGSVLIYYGLLSDVTKRKEMEASLYLAKFIFDKAAIGIYQIGLDGRILNVNSYAARMLGYSPEEMTRLYLWDIDPNIRADAFEESRTKVSGGRDTFETEVVQKNGLSLQVEVSLETQEYEGQQSRFAFVRDIAERKQIEQELREKDLMLHDMGRQSKIGAWKFDVETGEAISTEEVARILDIDTVQDVSVEASLNCFYGESRATIERANRDLVAHGIPYDLELELLSVRGVRKWVRVIGQPVMKDGRVVQAQGSIQDISERKKLESALRLTQFIYDKAPIGIWRIGENGEVIDVNEQGCASLGYTREELCRMTVFDFAPGFGAEEWAEGLATLEEAGTRTFEALHRRKNGEVFPLQVIENRIRFEDQMVHVAFVQDITGRRLAEEAVRESEARLKHLTANVPGVVIQFRASRDNVYSNEFLNAKITDIFGLEQNSETVLEQFYACIPDSEKQGYVASMQKAIDSASPWNYEGRFNKPDGGTIWFVGHALPQVEGDSVVFYGVLQDITDRKKMESALHLTQFIYDKAPIGIWRMGRKGEILDVNEQGYTSLGYTKEELCRMKVYDFDPNFSAEIWEDNVDALKEAGVTVIETRHQRRNGEIFPIQVTQKRVKYENQVIHVAFVQEITERKRMEQALHESEERLDLALEGANEGIWDWHVDEEIMYLDSRYYGIAGYEPDEFPGTLDEIGRHIHEADYERVRSTFLRYLAGDLNDYEVQFRYLRKDGTYMWVLSRGKVAAWDSQGKPTRFIGTNADITPLKQTEEALRENEEELRRLQNYLSNIIDSMPSILVAVDGQGKVTQWNTRAEQITGISYLQARSQLLSAVYPRLAEKMGEIETAIRERRVISDLKISSKTGADTRFEDITIFPLVANGVEGAVIRLDDVTEQVRMEEMIIQNEKMLTVGGLAAGMAHEINNPLAGILQTSEVMSNRLSSRLDTPANKKAAEEAGVTLEGLQRFMQARGIFRMIDTINSSGRRVADIVSNMLSFARKSDEGLRPHSLNQLLDATLELAATDYDLKKDYDFKKIKIIREYSEALPPVPCESSKIQQVLLNILGNGAQAMKSAGIEEPRFVVRSYWDKGRNMVCLEIEDNGPGMDEATRKKVFDPFFTTKAPGKGTGLGMSVSYFIITENHGGEMAVESEPGGGAKFIIRLPMQQSAMG